MIKLYGAEWCQPCQQCKQLLTVKGVEFKYLDVDKHPEEVQQLGIRSIPVLVKENGDMLRGNEYNGLSELWEWVSDD